MIINCSKENLINSINIVLKSVPSRTTLPILECVLLTAYKNVFKLTSNDLEIGIETSNIEANIIEEGSIALDAKMFYDIIKNMPDSQISISTDSNFFTTIKSDNTKFKILGQNPEQFPKINFIDKQNKITINSSIFKNMVKNTKFSVSFDESKPTLNGELFEIKNGFFNVVAIDGFRVSFRKTSLSFDDNNELIVPIKTLNELIKIIPDKEDSFLSFYFNHNVIMFELENCIMISRLLEGEFIKYEQIFNEEYNTKIKINRIDFLNSLERASLISKDNKKTPVKLNITPDKLIITSNTDFGNSYEEVNINFEGESIEIAFNTKFLIEVLKSIEDDFIFVQFLSKLSPCIIKPISSDDYKYLILPLKIN